MIVREEPKHKQRRIYNLNRVYFVYFKLDERKEEDVDEFLSRL